jgi:hypothetical protein
MKNIHVISTSNPSKILKDLVDKTYQFKKEVSFGNRIELPLNIYITSDVDIEEGEEFWYNNGGEWYKSIYRDYYKNLFPYGKKIILTTDDQLIKDNVQAIDDEFLEWFVKNPSCEYVRIEHERILWESGKITHYKYKIIIPEENPDLEEYIRLVEKYTSPKEEQNSDKKYSEEDMKKAFHVGKLNQGREGDTSFEKFIEKFKNK